MKILYILAFLFMLPLFLLFFIPVYMCISGGKAVYQWMTTYQTYMADDDDFGEAESVSPTPSENYDVISSRLSQSTQN